LVVIQVPSILDLFLSSWVAINGRPKRYQAVIFSATDLTPGCHSLTIEAIGLDNEPPGATVERVVLDAFDVY